MTGKVVAMPRKRADKEAQAFKQEFANRLRALRIERGWTQAELGEKVGVTGSVIRSYELRFHHPPLVTLHRMAKVFGITVDFLLNGSSEPPEGFSDRELLDLFLKADSLHHTRKGALKQVIEGLLAAEQLQKVS